MWLLKNFEVDKCFDSLIHDGGDILESTFDIHVVAMATGVKSYNNFQNKQLPLYRLQFLLSAKMSETLQKLGIYFDEVDKVRILQPDTAKLSSDLKEECKLYIESRSKLYSLKKYCVLLF